MMQGMPTEDPQGADPRDSQPADAQVPQDGRAARALRTHQAVADALLDLIDEGDLQPTSKSIAERAGVSARTIFQHFEDLESLFNVAAGRVGDRIMRNLRSITPDGPFETKLGKYLDELQYMHETMTSVRRASRLHEPFSPQVKEGLGTWRKSLREGIDKVFGPEIDQVPEGNRRAVLEALALVASWSSWENMLDHSGFSADEARATISLGFRRILQQPSPPPVCATDAGQSA
jgi:TetR/AcrR family transcriptional regulator of autoinduction and epiphytic fitness